MRPGACTWSTRTSRSATWSRSWGARSPRMRAEAGSGGLSGREAEQPGALREAPRAVDHRRLVVGVEEPANEAHLVLGRHAEVDRVVLGVLPLARVADALAGQQPVRG